MSFVIPTEYSNSNFQQLIAICAPGSGIIKYDGWHKDCPTNVSIANWDVRDQDIAFLFQGATYFNQSVWGWDTSSSDSMENAFQMATSFDQPLQTWDVSSVRSFKFMFDGASYFNQPLNNWDVSTATSTQAMFRNATHFDQPLAKWDVSLNKDMSYMFALATRFNQPLDSWDIQSVNALAFVLFGATSFNQELGGGWSSACSAHENVDDKLDKENCDVCDFKTNTCIGYDCQADFQVSANCSKYNSRCVCVLCDAGLYSGDCSKTCPEPALSVFQDLVFTLLLLWAWYAMVYYYFAYHEPEPPEIDMSKDYVSAQRDDTNAEKFTC
jgi:hypothetical protein